MANFFTWTDDPIVADSHKIRSIHVTELCDNMNKIRGYITDYDNAWGGGGGVALGDTSYDYGFTDDPVQHDVDKTRDDHVNDLRDALDDVNTEWGSYHSGWSWCEQYSNSSVAITSARLVPDTVKVRSVHINELRRQLDLVDQSMIVDTPFCGTSCQVSCQTSCQTACQYSCQGCNNGTCHDQMCGFW